MKAKANHWVKYNGEWHGKGEVFSIDKADAEEMKQYAELMEDETPEPEQREPAKRGRKRKAEAEE